MTLPSFARLGRFVLMILCLATALAGPARAQTEGEVDAPAEEAAGETEVQTLIDLLESDEARAALIERLRAAAETPEGPGDAVVEALAGEGEEPAESLSFGRRIAEITQGAVESFVADVQVLQSRLTGAGGVFDGLGALDLPALFAIAGELALLIVVTVGVFLVLRMMAKRLYARLDRRSQDARILRKIEVFVLTAVIDLLIVFVSLAAGYAVATLALGEMGQIGIRQTLFLNAFLVVETLKVGVRMVLSPAATETRLFPMSDETALRLARRVSTVVGIVGYGELVAVPIINAQLSYTAGNAVTALIAILVLLIAVSMVLRDRTRLADWMTGDRGIAGRGVGHWLARRWHWPVLAYLFAVFVIVLLSPPRLVFGVLATSGQVVLVVLLGIAVSTLLTRIMTSGIALPQNVNDRLPLLQSRLNRFVPRALFVVRLLIVAFVVLFALDAISLVPLREWMASQFGVAFTANLISVAFILIFAFAIWLGLTSFVDYKLNPEFGAIPTSREKTLLTLLRNAGTIALLIITLMFALAEIGLNIAPLLASAGVLGLAIGFGAQKMVQDIITGLFIQFENAINVGDVITVGGTTGTVERLTIRSVSLRDLSGVFHIIPFSSVDMVSNYMRDFGYFVCDMGVAYRENVDEVKVAMLDAFEELRAMEDHAPNIMGDLEWFGVQELADSAVVLRARIKCVPGTQWGIGRVYNEICKRVFDARGIEIPFPHQTIYLGEAKDGTTQTFRVGAPKATGGDDTTRRPVIEDDRAAEPTRDEPIDPDEG